MNRLAALFMAVALGGSLLVGCALGPDYHRPAVTAPESWRTTAADSHSLAQIAWWNYYHDPVLTNLITIALTNNLDLRLAVGRLAEAAGSLQGQRSYFLPTVNGNGTYTRSEVGNAPAVNQYSLLGSLAYEVDVWGRLRRLSEAAQAQYLAAASTRNAVQISLIASVASTYFNLRGLDQQLEIARNTAKSRTNILALAKIKYDGQADGHGYGIVSEIDVRQAETQVFTANSTIASLEQAIAIAENSLRYLLGLNPGPIPRGQPLTGQWQPDAIPAGLPSDLLLRRPDIQAAEEKLVAANANIGAARAAFFPTISLTAALGVQSLQLNDLFSLGTSRMWSFSPQIAAPIFNAGRIAAGVAIARAQKDEAVASYQQAIQNAFQEVDNALASVTDLRAKLVADEGYVQAEQRLFELAQLRYTEGIASYSDLLDAQRYLFAAQLQAVQTRASLLVAVAQLYQALGGGWTDQSSSTHSH